MNKKKHLFKEYQFFVPSYSLEYFFINDFNIHKFGKKFNLLWRIPFVWVFHLQTSKTRVEIFPNMIRKFNKSRTFFHKKSGIYFQIPQKKFMKIIDFYLKFRKHLLIWFGNQFFKVNNFQKLSPNLTILIKNWKFTICIVYSLNLNQSKSTDYQWNLTDSNS